MSQASTCKCAVILKTRVLFLYSGYAFHDEVATKHFPVILPAVQ